MPLKSLNDACHHNLVPTNQFYTEKAKLDPPSLGYRFDRPFAFSRRHVPTLAIYTLATLATQSLSHPAWATSNVDMGYQPDSFSENNQPTEGIETSKVQETPIASRHQAIALPESTLEQEFTPVALTPSNSATTQPKQDTIPTFGIEPAVQLETKEALNTPIPTGDVSQTKETFNAPIVTGDISQTTLPLTTPLNTAIKEDSQTLKEAEIIPNSPKNSNQSNVQPVVVTPVRTITSANIAPPETQLDVTQPLTSGADQLAVKPVNSSESSRCKKVESVAFLDQATSREASCLEVEQLQQELRRLEDQKLDDKLRVSPALSIVIPTAFGADNNTGFISGTYQGRTRFSDIDDGALGIGIGLGDAQKSVGVELSYAIASFGSNRDFGSGGFNVKVHRRLANDWAVAAGWNGFLNIGDDNDFEHSVYGVVSKIFRTRDDINQPFSRIAVTAGVGNGQFRTEDAVADDRGTINVFGNIAVRIAEPVSLIAEWSGQDLGVGVSIAPFKNIPLVITPALRDITGAGDGTRFVVGLGLAFKL